MHSKRCSSSSASEQGINAEFVLAEAQMELAAGTRPIDDNLAERLELVAKDASLPVAYRARAMSLLCRLG